MINLSTWFLPFGENDCESVAYLQESIGKQNAFFSDEKEAFEESYRSYLPKTLNGFLYGVSGTQAIEHAILVAQKITGKKKILYFHGSYHGNSLTLLDTVLDSRKENPDSIFIKVQPPYCYRCQNKCNGQFKCLTETIFSDTVPLDEIAGIIVDPAFGNLVLEPGIEYFKILREKCTEHNILLIFDEIRVAFGRCGSDFAFMNLGIVPDILCLSKAIACGMPCSLTIYDSNRISYEEITEKHKHIASTFATQNVALHMAEYTLKRIDTLVNSGAFHLIHYFREQLDSLLEYDCVGSVRNFGMIYAIEFINPKNGSYSVARGKKFVNEIMRRGIHTNGTRYQSVVLIHPYITITKEEIDTVIGIFHEALKCI